ncbi:MAG TPA: hypothetical protein VFB72_01190 [Verrucomicrobiae bacterium]|nr:hypothetical protein [Verrucomicrobiae bacterium]
MARKLYIFNPTRRVKMAGAEPGKWLGGYSETYAYLGDYQARMLGVGGAYLSARRLPAWLHTQPEGAKHSKGGASRTDRGFRGWG